MKKSLGILFMLNLADISLTRYLCKFGATELNPIIKRLIAIDFSWAILFKLAVGSLFVILAYHLHKKSEIVKPLIGYANLLFSFLILYQIYGILVLRYNLRI